MVFAEHFLTYPDLFPARHAGEAWGAEEVSLALAGGPYKLRGLNLRQSDDVAGRFGGICAAGQGSAQVEVDFFRAAKGDFRDVPLQGQTYSLDVHYAPGHVSLAGLWFMARLDWKPTVRGTLWCPFDGGGFFLGAVENFFRVLLSYRILSCGGAALHSAGLLTNGKALLFLGPSGAGKTTLSRLGLEAGHRVLSDDLNVVWRDDGTTRVSRVPFSGELATTAAVPEDFELAGVFLLSKGVQVTTRPLSPGQGVAAMLSCASYLNVDPYNSGELLQNIESLLSGVAMGVLTFAPDSSFLEIQSQIKSLQ